MRSNKLFSTLIIICGFSIVLLQVIISGSFSNYTGTDDQSVDIIQDIAPNYKPWANNIFEHKSDWSEMLVFAIQASLGLAIIVFYILKQRKKTLAE